jgi:NAD(P)-dependent dehydrogenase (short-subunit alcohol dehydrogenase family)
MNRERFRGKNVFITGAGSGFGRATAVRFADEGAANVYLVDIMPDRLDRVRDEVKQRGANPVPIQGSILDIAACDRAIEAALKVDPRLDVMVSNAAPGRMPTPFLEMPDSVWLEDVQGILTASFVFGQRAARAMVKTGGGVILFTISVSALGAGRGFAAYCAAKSGQVALVQVMAVELAPYKIRVNGVSPGPADTQRSVDFLGEAVMKGLRRSFPVVPLGRLASADDIANAFLYLASDEAAYVTGTNLVVDGGLTAQIYDAPTVPESLATPAGHDQPASGSR